MTEEVLKQLVKEVRDEFQIPPYFPDTSLTNYAKEGEAFLQSKKSHDIETDMTARSLLKNYINYAYFKRLDEFENNYNHNIVGWQLEDDNGNTGIQ